MNSSGSIILRTEAKAVPAIQRFRDVAAVSPFRHLLERYRRAELELKAHKGDKQDNSEISAVKFHIAKAGEILSKTVEKNGALDTDPGNIRIKFNKLQNGKDAAAYLFSYAITDIQDRNLQASILQAHADLSKQGERALLNAAVHIYFALCYPLQGEKRRVSPGSGSTHSTPDENPSFENAVKLIEDGA